MIAVRRCLVRCGLWPDRAEVYCFALSHSPPALVRVALRVRRPQLPR